MPETTTGLKNILLVKIVYTAGAFKKCVYQALQLQSTKIFLQQTAALIISNKDRKTAARCNVK